ncbi:hypothetical protein A2U01_0085903, partial [Trifolium medium]|nr:hypothetical protein [Trifolium medium]
MKESDTTLGFLEPRNSVLVEEVRVGEVLVKLGERQEKKDCTDAQETKAKHNVSNKTEGTSVNELPATNVLV